MTDKLQLMLINVLLDQFLHTNVSQSSVLTRLRCDGILNDQFITVTAEPESENILKIGQYLLSYGYLSTGLFFYETRCISILYIGIFSAFGPLSWLLHFDVQ